MSGHNANFGREWLKKAEHDLITARAVLGLPDGPTDTPCFHAQQAIEKALKGVLTLHGVPCGRTHDLLILLDQVAPHLPGLVPFEAALGAITAYAVDMRYPGDAMEPDRMEAVEALHTAETVIAMVLAGCFTPAPTTDQTTPPP